MLQNPELHYLDNAATTIVAPEVADDIRHFRGHDGGGGVVQIMQFRVLQHKF